jgi:hypothetical protein
MDVARKVDELGLLRMSPNFAEGRSGHERSETFNGPPSTFFARAIVPAILPKPPKITPNVWRQMSKVSDGINSVRGTLTGTPPVT